MTGISNRFSTIFGLAVVLGFGMLALFFFQARAESSVSEIAGQPTVAVSPGIRLKFQTDKNIYQSGDDILLALRNDSRKTIWLSHHADGCAEDWWQLERLSSDGETWQTVPRTKQTCQVKQYTSQPFPRHSLTTATWNLDVPSPKLGNLVTTAPAGTYRFVAP